MKTYLFLICIYITTYSLIAQETITFKAADGLEVTANLYMMHDKNAPFIVLFHQANWSRGEYLEIAPKLNGLGYNCLAVDQRSGGSVNGVPNKTKIAASHAMKGTNYINALPDLMAAITYAKENFVEGKLIVWGSSYSSSLVLKIAGDHPTMFDAALAFAPGEYFTNMGKAKDWITSSAKNITIPVFITSAKNEKRNWWNIYEEILSERKSYFLPETSGNHGSRALFEKFSDSREYWIAVTDFLESVSK